MPCYTDGKFLSMVSDPGFLKIPDAFWLSNVPQALVEKGLDHTAGTDMEATLADPVKIRQWQVRGLDRNATWNTHIPENGACSAEFRCRWLDASGSGGMHSNRMVSSIQLDCAASAGDTIYESRVCIKCGRSSRLPHLPFPPLAFRR